MAILEENKSEEHTHPNSCEKRAFLLNIYIPHTLNKAIENKIINTKSIDDSWSASLDEIAEGEIHAFLE